MAVFTMREAARVAGVSVSTLRRRRADLVAALRSRWSRQCVRRVLPAGQPRGGLQDAAG